MPMPSSVSIILKELPENIELNGADILSDRFGYCVHSFDYEVKETRNGYIIGFYNIEWDDED